jgi:hypothetical protein
MSKDTSSTDYAKILLCTVGVAFIMAVMLAPNIFLVGMEFDRQEMEHVRQVDALLKEIGELKDRLIVCEGEG